MFDGDPAPQLPYRWMLRY